MDKTYLFMSLLRYKKFLLCTLWCFSTLYTAKYQEEKKQRTASMKDGKAVDGAAFEKLLQGLRNSEFIPNSEAFLQKIGWPSKKITKPQINQIMNNHGLYLRLFCRNKHGKYALTQLVEELHAPLYSVRNQTGGNTLHIAVQQGNQKALQYLCENRNLLGLTITKTSRAETLLHTAVAQGNLNALRYLLANRLSLGLQVSAKDAQGYNLFHKAVSCGQVATLKFLHKEQESLDISPQDQTRDGTLLHIAVQYAQKSMVKHLWKCRLHYKINTLAIFKPNNGKTLLDVASSKIRHFLLQELIPVHHTFDTTQGHKHIHIGYFHSLVAQEMGDPIACNLKSIFEKKAIKHDAAFYHAFKELLPCLHYSTQNALLAHLKVKISLKNLDSVRIVALIRQAFGINKRTEYKKKIGNIHNMYKASERRLKEWDEMLWEAFTSFSVRQHITKGYFYYNQILEAFCKKLEEKPNSINQPVAFYQFLWERIHDKEKQPPNFHRNVFVQNDVLIFYIHLFNCMGTIEAITKARKRSSVTSFILIPHSAKKLPEKRILYYEHVQLPKMKLSAKILATSSEMPEQVRSALSDQYHHTLILLDTREERTWLYIYQYNSPNNINYFDHLALVKKQISLERGMMTFTNIYTHTQSKRFLKSYFHDGEGACLLCTEHFIQYIPKHFECPISLRKRKFIIERLDLLYRNTFPPYTRSQDERFIAYYKGSLASEVNRNSTNNAPYKLSCVFKKECPYYLAECGYAKYVIDMFRGKLKEDNLSLALDCFNHFIAKHTLCTEKCNAKIVGYFQDHLGNCTQQENCKYVALCAQDTVSDDEAIPPTYEHVYALLHTYLLHLGASLTRILDTNVKAEQPSQIAIPNPILAQHQHVAKVQNVHQGQDSYAQRGKRESKLHHPPTPLSNGDGTTLNKARINSTSFEEKAVLHHSVNDRGSNVGVQQAWEQTPLQASYKATFCDESYINRKRSNGRQRAVVNTIYGITEDNTRELLIMEIDSTQSEDIWNGYFAKLKERGVQRIGSVVTDGGLRIAAHVKKHYPQAAVSACAYPLQKNTLEEPYFKHQASVSIKFPHVPNNFNPKKKGKRYDTTNALQAKEVAWQKPMAANDSPTNRLKQEKTDREESLRGIIGALRALSAKKKEFDQKLEETKQQADAKEANVLPVARAQQPAANEALFQQKLKDNRCEGGVWYKENIPKDLASIRKAYPLMQQEVHKQAALEISHGLATVPTYDGWAFHVKVQYWYCKLYALQKKVTPSVAKQLVCSLKGDLKNVINKYCPHHGKKVSPLPAPTSTLHNPNWKARFAYAHKGWKHYNARSKDCGGLNQYKKRIQKEMEGLQTAYPKLQTKKHKKEALALFIALSEMHRFEYFAFLLQYLKVQNRLLELNRKVGYTAKNDIVYTPTLKSPR